MQMFSGRSASAPARRYSPPSAAPPPRSRWPQQGWPMQMFSGRSASVPRVTSPAAAANSSRRSTGMTPRSRAAGATSSSTATSPGARSCGGVAVEDDDGYFAGRSGVWRRELRPGEASGPIEPVAVGAQVPGSEGCAGAVPCDAVLPSVSANGQFVSFTTAARLDPVNDSNEAPDVYVRNMALGESQPGAFTLVSAADGTSAGLTYEGPLTHGAVASGRTAISADGNEVAFVTTAISDLTDPGTPGEPRTPALQVAVRNLSARTTELVSAEYDPATGQAKPGIPVSAFEANETWGAVYTTAAAGPSFPFNNRAYDLPPVVGASISADGTTVAWMGRVVHKQARMLPGEAGARYAEPLWRRIADGPLAPTRRVTGGSEPENPACAASGEQNVPAPGSASLSDPCQGPFAVTAESGVWAGSRGNADTVPQLSGDGYTVVFFAGAQLVALGSNFGRSGEELADLYIANMHPGLTRRAALRPLTELATGHETERAGDAPVVDASRSEEHTTELQSRQQLVCRLTLA